MSTEPSERSLKAMARERVILQGAYCIDPDAAAQVADRLIAEAVQADRQRILALLVAEEWPDPDDNRHMAILVSDVRSIVEDTP